MDTKEREKLEKELNELREREKRLERDLKSRDCVGIHRDLCFKELERIRKQIKVVWAKLHKKD